VVVFLTSALNSRGRWPLLLGSSRLLFINVRLPYSRDYNIGPLIDRDLTFGVVGRIRAGPGYEWTLPLTSKRRKMKRRETGKSREGSDRGN